MKTILKSTILGILLLAASQLFGGQVDVPQAKTLADKFVSANFNHNAPLTWVYTAVTENGRPAFHAFNGASGGFVIVTASDLTSPILGYSETGVFNPENLPDGLEGFLDGYAQSVDFAEERMTKADAVIQQEWENLEKHGRIQTAKLGFVLPLIATQWNQECYYNEYCPEDPAGWCGHVKVGCVATAMGQIMKYWNYPEHGTGSHSYNSYFFGEQYANFGATTYHWEEMPDQVTEPNDAVATLLYHCGVSVDMAYAPAPSGSGASEASMATALRTYFNYSGCQYKERSNFQYGEWTAMMRQMLDSHIPIPYSGIDTEQGAGGHSFICDGYDANGLFHFNWGWSGELDGYFSIDNMQTYTLSWNASQAMIVDVRPTTVHNATAQAPTGLNVQPSAADPYTCSISWVNPSKTLNNSTLPAIDQIVVKRDGQVIYTEDHPTPGALMEITDEVPFFALYDYSVYAVCQGYHGEATTQTTSFGPSCNWSILTSTTSAGWKGASITLYNNSGQMVERFSPTTSSQVFSIPVPIGRVSFAWDKGNSTASNVTFTIKDADDQQVFQYSGSPADLSDGVFLAMNNSCGNPACGQPAELYAHAEGNDVVLDWSAAEGESAYNVYRDGVVVRTVRNGATAFVDENLDQGGHCYFVTALCEGGESEPTNEACATAGEGCEPATGLWYEMTPNNKVKLTWVAPQPNDGLTGYYVYRTKESEMNWKRIKALNASTSSYTDNSTLENETSYLYKLVAYYQAIDCYSAPARSRYSEFEYFLRVYWSVDGVDEPTKATTEVYPNPGNDRLNVRTSSENAVIQVFNIYGEQLISLPLSDENTTINAEAWPSGMYVWKVISDGGEVETGKWIKE